MPEGDLVQWFGSLPPLTQIFFGIFLFLVAIPIATLIVFQLIDSLRSLRSAVLGNAARKRTAKKDEWK